MAMERKQIYLDPGTDRRLKKLAKKKGASEASLIREALDVYLAKAEGDQTAAEDPLLRLVGIYRGALPAEAAADHDRYLYGGDEEH